LPSCARRSGLTRSIGVLTMRAVIYARYSSDNQRDASIEDQVCLCRERIAQKGWELVQVFRNAAISGATTLRPGYPALLEGAREASFDVSWPPRPWGATATSRSSPCAPRSANFSTGHSAHRRGEADPIHGRRRLGYRTIFRRPPSSIDPGLGGQRA
jgi:hypothetical protein